jgi:Asp-tRNA(Asn)/Glu-tRNA(Gln) amidotransferase A subunit family amidase
MQITGMSAVELVAGLGAGRLSAAEVVDAHIARTTAVNPALNALAVERFASARAEAARADAAPASARGPLHGLPVTIKAAFDVAGSPSTCGLSSRADHVPARDAAMVARLRAAGAIVIGQTNTPDSCWSQETANQLYGRTNNPWDLSRSVGGSTGGEAALIAAGGSPLGIGSDIAGSIRMPSAFCGIAGLRPTSGALDEAGFWPPSAGRLAGLNAVGPMARRVEDLALAYDVLRGEVPRQRDPALIRGAALAHWLDDGFTPSSPALRAGVRAAAAALERAGMRPVAGAPAARRLAALGWSSYTQAPERRAVAQGFGGGQAWSPLAELARALGGRGRVGATALAYWQISHATSLLAEALGVDGARWRYELRAQIADLLGPGGVAVCPVFPTTAPRHGWSWGSSLLTLGYQAWVNLAGLPGLALPVGFTRAGMPVGVQLVAAPGGEEALLAAGLAVQRDLMPRWVGPAI